MSLAQCSFQLFWLARLLGFSVQFQIFALNDFTGFIGLSTALSDSHRPHDRDRKRSRIPYPRSPSITVVRGAWPAAAFEEKGLLGWLTHGVLEYATPMLVVALACSDIVATECFGAGLGTETVETYLPR